MKRSTRFIAALAVLCLCISVSVTALAASSELGPPIAPPVRPGETAVDAGIVQFHPFGENALIRSWMLDADSRYSIDGARHYMDSVMTRAAFIETLFEIKVSAIGNGESHSVEATEQYFSDLDSSALGNHGVDTTERRLDWLNFCVNFFRDFGVVMGKENNKFCPNDLITMEEVGVLIARTCRVFDEPIREGPREEREYRDGAIYGANGEEIARPSAWAYDDIVYVSDLLGVSPNLFAPNRLCTQRDVYFTVAGLFMEIEVEGLAPPLPPPAPPELPMTAIGN